MFFTQCYYWDASKLFCRNLSMQCLTLSWLKKNLRPADNFSCSQSYTLPDLNVCWELRKTREKSRVDIFDLLFCRQSGSSSCIRRSSIETVGHFILERHFGKKMRICLVLSALMVAVAFGHNKDEASYAAKKAAKLSFKVSLGLLIESLL